MKKKLYILLVALGIALPLAVAAAPRASAVDVFGDCQNGSAHAGTDICKETSNQSSSNSNPVVDTLKTVINIFSLIVGLTAVIILIISGLRMVVSLGDPGGFQKGRDGIIYAVVGLVITGMSQLIVAFVLNRLQ